MAAKNSRSCNSMPRITSYNVCYTKLLRAFEEATARGDGSIAFGGQLIDPPIVERAIRTLELAESLETRQPGISGESP